MRIKYAFLAALLLIGVSATTVAQTSTFYFMDEVPTRHTMNPAFRPNSSWYLDFIVLPSFYVSGGTNMFTLKDGLFNSNGQTITALHPSQNIDQLYKRIHNVNTVDFSFGLTVLDFGFSVKEKNYFTFGLSLKGSGAAYLSRDVMRLAMYGTPDEDGINSFNFTKTGIEASLYSEAALGYMRQINDKWTVGGKLKFLMGYANIYTKNNNMRVDASQDAWDVTADAEIMGSIPMDLSARTSDGQIDFGQAKFYEDANGNPDINRYVNMLYNPSGLGGAVDLGVTFKPIENLTISAAVTDLGFINWNKNIVSGSMNGTFRYEGIEYHSANDSVNWQAVLDEFKNSFDFKTEEGKSYNQMLTAGINVGVEYGVLDNKISFGALSRTNIHPAYVQQQVTLAANFRPTDWLKTYLSYSFFNGRASNLGLGISFRMGAINTYIVSDFVPLQWANVSTTNAQGERQTMPLPYNTSYVNLQAGMTFNFGRNSSDRDRDGVKNSKDRCPDTDIKALSALCPDVKRKDFVDKEGCTLDQDKDGVPDCYDRCPDTPAGVTVDEYGCPVDTDGDGVPDYLDECPDTPTGVKVDAKGCPIDSDGDGVPDYLDQCPDTPKAAIGFTDEHGCPKDSDGDGVPDYIDQCPDTPQEAYTTIDEYGCPKDSDGDGVPDYIDRCPNTPKEAYGKVDEFGCPKDSDGDGIPDYLDRCPEIPGVKENNGCPELKAEVKRLFKQALQGIQFETGKDVIKPVSFPILNQVAAVMAENPDFLLTISGHTDNVGKPDMNQNLSERRAASVMRYLESKGVAATRMSSEGHGDKLPVATNSTAAGRKLNRRVEFSVIFER